MDPYIALNLPASQGELLLDDSYLNDLGMITPSQVIDYAEETMDVGIVGDCQLNIPQEQFVPFSPRGPPEKTEMPGQFNFKVEVTSKDAHKKKFLYSHQLGRIYVDMNCNFSMLFNWDLTATSQNMYVRATTVFADDEQSQKRVERCVQHYHEDSRMLKEIAKNVLHSSREIGTQGVYYCGQADVLDSWYSVLVHFRKLSPEPCCHAYKFTCKSSCASGINRRAIAIIFTLEDSAGNVYGRHQVGVKVCSCLRRDMHKDEEAEGVYKTGKKRVPSNQISQPKTKKIKLESKENVPNMLMLPKIAVEANAMMSGLRTMIDMMTNAGLHDPEVVDKYAESIAELRKVLLGLEPANTQPPTQPQ